MLSQMILCSLIDDPDVTDPELKQLRGFDREFAVKLAESIRVEGLHQPIVVRPNPDAPGRYLRVVGKHRLHAVSKLLKEEAIEARVMEDMDATEAEMASIAENLWRSPLKKAQYYIAIKRWFEHYEARNSDKIGSGKAGRAAKLAKSAQTAETDEISKSQDLAFRNEGEDSAQAGEATATDPQDGNAALAETSANNFPEEVAAATGASLSSAKMTQKIAKAFTADQLEALDQSGVGRVMQYRIACVKDQAKRGEVVNLIASGMDHEAAFAAIMDAPDTATPEAAATQAKTESELTDDEWLTTYCGEFRLLLKDPGIRAMYDRDAIFYRQDRESRIAYRSKNRKRLANAPTGGRGPFVKLVARVCNVAHPRDWLLCSGCQGDGTGESKGKCSNCYGSGYLVKAEVVK